MSDTEHSSTSAGQDNKAFTGDQKTTSLENPTFSCAPDGQINVDSMTNTNTPQIEDEEPLDLRFGIWRFKSEVLGRLFSRLSVFSVMTGAVVMLSVAGLKIINMFMTQLQTQFHLNGVTKEDFTRAHSIGVVVSCLLCGYLGSFGKINIPIWIGIASYLSGLAMMAPAFVHLANPFKLYVDHATKDLFYAMFLMCPAVSFQTLLIPKRDDVVYAIFTMAHAVCGLLLPVVSVLAPIYIDNNCVNKKKLGLFLGIFVILSEIAPLSAIGGGGLFGNFAVDLKETELNILDPRFVPAWWLPVLLYGAFMCLIGCSIAGFPRRLVPKHQQKSALVNAAKFYFREEGVCIDTKDESVNDPSSRKENFYNQLQDVGLAEVKQTETQTLTAAQTSLGAKVRASLPESIVFRSLAMPRNGVISGIKDIPFQLYRVVVNPALVLFLVVMVITAVPLRGSEGLKQQFMIFEYGVSVTTSGFGIIPSMVSNIVGLVISAVICSRVTSLRGYALLILAGYFLSSVFAPFYFATSCKNVDVIGLKSPFSPQPVETTPCNCSNKLPYPTCGDDGQTYLSPCYAGCTGGDGFTFVNCSLLTTDQHGTQAKFAVCPPGCMDKFIGFVLISTLVTMGGQMAVLPRNILLLRMLEPRDRSWGLSLVTIVYYLASISSQRWSQEILDFVGCLVSASGNCLLYDRPAISHLMSSVDLGVYTTLLIIALVIYGVFEFKALKLKSNR